MVPAVDMNHLEKNVSKANKQKLLKSEDSGLYLPETIDELR